MKTKEEVIKEAWGEHFDTVKNYINKFGWCIDKGHKLFHQHRIYDNDEDFDFVFDGNWDYNEVEKYRPKSLRGIEDNNMWIRIKSESDLPKKIIECVTCFYDGKNYILGDTRERNPIQLWKSFKNNQITHYKPIIKHEKPLY